MANIIKTSPKNKSKAERTKLRRRKVIIIISVVSLALIVVAAGLAYLYSRQQSAEQAAEKSAADVRAEELQSHNEQASKVSLDVEPLIEAGDVKGLTKAYDKALAGAKSDGEKAALYLSQAMSLDRMGKAKPSLAAALKADKLDSDKQLVAQTESLIANTAYDLGDWQLALDYYERQYERLKATPADMGNPLPGLEKRITELKGKLGND